MTTVREASLRHTCCFALPFFRKVMGDSKNNSGNTESSATLGQVQAAPSELSRHCAYTEIVAPVFKIPNSRLKMKEPEVGVMWMRGFRSRFIKTIGCFSSGELVWATHFIRNARLKQRAIRAKTRRWKRERKTEKAVEQFGSGVCFFYSSTLLHSGTDKPVFPVSL